MRVTIAGKVWVSKKAIKEECRRVLYGTPWGEPIAQEDIPFMVGVFEHHTEWESKRGVGLSHITTGPADGGTSCFFVVREDGTRVDISFWHAIKCIGVNPNRMRESRHLYDFKKAARHAVVDQILDFRDRNRDVTRCALSGRPLRGERVEVDHIHPRTFEALLAAFCRRDRIDPWKQRIHGDMSPALDPSIMGDWLEFHREHAVLQLVIREENGRAPKVKIKWQRLRQR